MARERGCIVGALLLALVMTALPRAGSAGDEAARLDAWLGPRRPPPPMRDDHWSAAGDADVLFVPVGGGSWTTQYTSPSESGGHLYSHGDYAAVLHTGLRLAAYAARRRGLHLGLFAAADFGEMRFHSDYGGERVSNDDPIALDFAAGFAFKWLRARRDRVTIGVDLDVGLAVYRADLTNSDVRAQLGAAASPRFVVELPFGGEDRCGLDLEIGLSASIVKGRALDSTDRITTRWMRLEPIMALGVAFGG